MTNSIGRFDNISRVRPSSDSDPLRGKVSLDIVKTVYYSLVLLGAIMGVLFYFSLGAVAIFLMSTLTILLVGHSVGMHRRLVHNSFECPLWLEYFMVYCGVLVGLGGPLTMIRTHDMRDWAQRQKDCHNFFSHQSHILLDAYWQLFCKIKLVKPPEISLEARIKDDRFYAFLEKYSMAAHLPLACIYFIAGGIGWVLIGVCLQIVTTVFGHWLIGHFAHNKEPKNWWVQGAAVQGRNVKFFEWITMGEAWHNNHHAFPSSARLGIISGQADPGWWFIQVLKRLGLAKNILLPKDLARRSNLVYIADKDISSCPVFDRAKRLFLGVAH